MALVHNQPALNTVYNHFLMTYAPTTNTSSRYDTHKKSELRSVYNSIIKQNKESPTYIIDTSRETQQFAVGMKENARQFSHTISSLSTDENGDVLSRKAAASSDDSTVSARFIGDPATTQEDMSFEVSVSSLATSQVNLGRYMNGDAGIDLKADTYSFDIRINDTDYEFQFNIGAGDTNRSIQDKLASLINRSNIGIQASVTTDDEGNSALALESSATGISPDQDYIFSVSDDHTSKSTGAVEYFGISDTTRPASNAQFSLNGVERTAFSNVFTVDKRFEISLNKISEEGTAVTIGLKPDVESLSDNIHQLVDSYNSFIDKASAYSGTNVRTDTLLSDMKRSNAAYRNELDAMGLTFDEDGRLNVNDEILSDRLSSEDNSSHLGAIKSFTQSLMRKSSQISLNPMNYVQKTVVAYKNPGRSFANPYVTSIYSGMMFNSYC